MSANSPIQLICALTCITSLNLKPALSTSCNDLQWGPWRCPGSESACYSMKAVRFRCPKGSCTDRSPCAQRIGNQQTMDCKTALKKDLCKPWFGSWNQWTRCDAKCGFQDQIRRRACRGAFSEGSKSDSCQDGDFIRSRRKKGLRGSVDTRPCPLGKPCPLFHGNWGDWSEFSACSASCGNGKRVRTRRCDNPPPSKFGRPCAGPQSEEIPCAVRIPCPVPGSWCPWVDVLPCLDPCKMAIGQKNRLCHCPPPQYNGQPCFGLPSKTYFCTENPCIGNYTMSLDEEDRLVSFLYNRTAKDMLRSVMLYDTISYSCPSGLWPRRQFFDKKDRFPFRSYYWTHNGKPIRKKKFKENFIESDVRLQIKRVRPQDLGVYMLVVDRYKSHMSPICYFILYTDDIKKVVHVGDHVVLDANVKGIDLVTDFNRSLWRMDWTFTPDKFAMDHGGIEMRFMKTSPENGQFASLSVYTISSIQRRQSGLYVCRLYRDGMTNTSYMNRTSKEAVFITARVEVVVVPPLPFWQEIRIWLHDNKWFIVFDFSLAVAITAYSMIDIRAWKWWEGRRL